MISAYLPGGYRSGVFELTAPVQLVRQQTDIKVPSIPAKTVAKSMIAGPLFGENMLSTVLRFSSLINDDSLINTIGYSDSNYGGLWNENNSKPIGTQAKSILCPILRDFAVDGKLGDITSTFRANGIHIKAIGARLDNLLLFNIPGTAVLIDAIDRSAFGWVSIYDHVPTVLNGICIHSSLGGVIVSDDNVIINDLSLFDISGTGLIIRADNLKAAISASSLVASNTTYVSLPENHTGLQIEIQGVGDSGTVLDLTGSNLDTIDGGGNEFKINWDGSATPVLYPGGGTEYNLADGTKLWINGVLQKAADVVQSDLEDKVYNFSSTITIPRQVPRLAIAPPYQGTAQQYPASRLSGKSSSSTILDFANTVTGQLIKSEEYGGNVSFFWNDNNIQGDTNLKNCAFGIVKNLSIEGRANLRPYPYTVSGADGTDFVPRADGLCIQGTGWKLSDLDFSQIPGTALVISTGSGVNAGPFSRYDWRANRAQNIFVIQSYAGINNSTIDGRMEHIEIVNVVTDGMTISGQAIYVDDMHVFGADRACVITANGVVGTDWYNEAARIGTHFAAGSNYSRVKGLQIGPGTCRLRGALIDANDISISELMGTVAATSGTLIAGVEVSSTISNVVIDGTLGIGAGSCGILLNNLAHHCRVKLVPNSFGSGFAGVRLLGVSTGNTIEVSPGWLDGGIGIDLSASSLNTNNGQGNVFVANANPGSGKQIAYPGYPTTNPTNAYNLAAGNFAYIKGVLQTTGMTN